MKLIYHPGTGTYFSLDDGLLLIDTKKVPPSLVDDVLDGRLVDEVWTRRITDVVTQQRRFFVTFGVEIDIEADDPEDAEKAAWDYITSVEPNLDIISMKEVTE